MAGINLAGRSPRVTSAMSPRVIYIGVALAVLGLGFIIYGFRYRIKKKEEQKAVVTTQIAASDAATSNRMALHGEPSGIPASQLNIPPVKSQDTPVGAANSALSPIGGAVQAVAQPFGTTAERANNCRQLPNGQLENCQAPATYVPSTAQSETDPVKRMKAAREQSEYERRLAAIDAPTGTTSASSPSLRNVEQMAADLNRLNAFPGSANGLTPQQQSQVIATRPSNIDADEDPNAQAAKRAFQQVAEGDYLKTMRMAPLSPWVVERGEVIPAGLPNQIVSDLPGDLVAEVKRDVYDTPSHKYVLIPAGSLLAGEYNSGVTYGQKRVQVIWTYLRFPDGSFVDLDKFVSHSADGAVGLSDQVDNHIKRLVGGIALTSLFAAGLQISQNRTTGNSTLSYPSNTQLAASAVGQQASELGQQVTRRNLDVQPSIKIRPGDVFYVSVLKSILFPGPYKSIQTGVTK